jgi:hypothetical protein
MKFEIGAMSVGDILDRGLKIFWARLPTFYAINLIVMTPVLAYQLATPFFLLGGDSGPPSPEMMLAFMLSSLGMLLLALILVPIGAAASLHVIGQEFIDERVGVAEAFRFALRRFAPLLGVSILVGLILFVGLIACVIPYFVFLTWYAFASQVVVMEGRGGMGALNRSKDLGNGFYWRVFGVLALLFVLSLVVGMINNILNQVFQPLEVVPSNTGPRFVLRSYGLYVVAQAVNFLLTVAVQSYSAVCTTLLYFDLRIRKEGFDLELAARQHKHEGAGARGDQWPEEDRYDEGIRGGKGWTAQDRHDEAIPPGEEPPGQPRHDEGPGTL